MRIFCKYHICSKSATTWHHVQIHKKATSLQHIGNRWLRGICSPATGAKIYAKLFICLYAKMAKMSDFSNHNIFAYMLASRANLNFHPVVLFVATVFTVSPPVIRSSTYNPSRIAFTSSGCLVYQNFKCSLIPPSRRNGEHVIPNKARVKRYTETSSQPGLCRKNLNESRSPSLMRTCKNAFSISPVSKIGWNRARTRTLHSGGPGCKHSFKDISFADAS